MLASNSVTFILVTHNSVHCLSELAKSLVGFESILIVDNKSNDGTPEVICEEIPQARLIRSEFNLGFGAANNIALGEVTTPYAFLLNPDCIITPDAIEQLLKNALDFPNFAIIAPQLVRASGLFEISYRWPTGKWRSTGPIASGNCCVGFVSGAAMLLNMSVMRRIGFFDERFFLYYEDEDLCHRVFAAKAQIILVPEARFTHLARGSVRGKHPLRGEFFRGYHHAQSKLIFEQKHHSMASANKLRWRTLLLALLTLLPRLLVPQPKYLARLCGRILGLIRFQHSQLERHGSTQ
jgi:GT2 family glycosyltransferase